MRGDFLPADEAREYADRIIELRERPHAEREREQHRGFLAVLLPLPSGRSGRRPA